MQLDENFFEFLFSFTGRYQWLDITFMFLADTVIYVLALLLLWFFLGRAKREKILFAAALLGAFIGRGLLTPLIRFAYHRPRPFVVNDIVPLVAKNAAEASLPSGHTVIMFVMAWAVWQHHRRWGVFFFVLAALSALSRVVVGIHYPLDILSGVVVAYISYAASHWVIKKFPL